MSTRTSIIMCFSKKKGWLVRIVTMILKGDLCVTSIQTNRDTKASFSKVGNRSSGRNSLYCSTHAHRRYKVWRYGLSFYDKDDIISVCVVLGLRGSLASLLVAHSASLLTGVITGGRVRLEARMAMAHEFSGPTHRSVERIHLIYYGRRLHRLKTSSAKATSQTWVFVVWRLPQNVYHSCGYRLP